MKIQLTRWTRNPQRIRCSSGLECARADIDTKAALRAFRPLLPQLPVNPKDVQSARVDVAVTESGRLRYLHVSGDLKVLLVEVPFQAALDVER